MAELNFHFKQLTEGAPREVLIELGEALLAVAEQRESGKGNAPDLLRRAYLSLARHVAARGTALNPQQRLFLLAGAVADSVAVKNTKGERVAIQLLPTATYEALLQAVEQSDEVIALYDYLLGPLNRMMKLASGELQPLDLNRPGRYRPPSAASDGKRQIPVETLKQELEQARSSLAGSLEQLSLAGRKLADCLRGERIAPLLGAVGQLAQLSQQALQISGQPDALVQLEVPADPLAHPLLAALNAINTELTAGFKALDQAGRSTVRDLGMMRGVAQAIVSGEEATEQPLGRLHAQLSPEALRLVDRDLSSVNGVVVQLLANAAHRTAWSPSRILLAEHTERFDDPLHDCFATPANLVASIAKAETLHPDCFPHDRQGRPLLPPIVIEPGAGIVKWYDDRFILSFVCNELPRKGSKLSLSGVDQAVMQMYGLFTARGDLYNYRGDRVSGNFIADYAGEVEQKAVAKFSGDTKKLTFTSATEVKDAASREDAVQDYIDFIFAAFNGLPIPKRINPRRIGVILTYCLIGDEEFTATLALRYVTQHDTVVAREILTKLANRDHQRVLQLITAAMRNDGQVASRFRREPYKAVHDVMGHEYALDLVAAGLLKRETVAKAPAADEEQGEDSPAGPAADHDYFDV